jgi:hypothetical protein
MRDFLLLLTLTALFTALASVKPIHIDEAANYYYARQIAEHPFDPYGFQMFWYQWPQPANHVLTPPVMAYEWAIVVRLCGLQPMLWRLGLLPFTLAFVFSMHALLRRFAPGLEMPLTWMTVLSPAFLPSLNLMPDIPALGLSLLAVVCFLRAADCGSWTQAGLAGLLAGLAMQTKYTAFVTPAVLLLRAMLMGRVRLGILAAFLATAVFAAWEALIAWKYGESHFWYQVQASGGEGLLNKAFLLMPLLPIVGAVAPVVGLLGLTALGVRRVIVLLGGVAIILGIGVLASTVGGYWVDVALPGWLERLGVAYQEEFTVPYLIFGAFGLVICGIAVGLAWACWERSPDGRFLVLWLGLELAGYFALTPFPAVRRVLALVLMLTLLAGRVLAGSSWRNGWLLRIVVVANIILGLLYFIVDVHDARAQMLGARAAAHAIREADNGRMWYVGHWGFQFYAEETGMRPVVPGASALKPGDWLVLPGAPIHRQEIEIPEDRSDFAFAILVEDRLPWRTVMGYYGGAEPLSHRSGARLTVEVRRVTKDWTPASAW